MFHKKNVRKALSYLYASVGCDVLKVKQKYIRKLVTESFSNTFCKIMSDLRFHIYSQSTIFIFCLLLHSQKMLLLRIKRGNIFFA